MEDSVKAVERPSCVICSNAIFSPIITLKNMPIYMGVATNEIYDDLFFDQRWVECLSCGCLQLNRLVPLNLLYSHSHNSVIGNIWKNHHLEFKKFVLENSPKIIIEIGGGDGYLANLILNDKFIQYTVVEPNPIKSNTRMNIIKDVIENNLEIINNADTIIHSHVLEHLYNPLQVLRSISDNMKVGARMIFSIPNIPRLISLDGGNALNFEHTYMLDKSQLEIIMNNLGFKMYKKFSYLEHSFFYSFIKMKTSATNLLEIPNISINSKNFKQMIINIDNFVDRLNNMLKNNEDNFIFGAHVFTQILFNRGLDSDRFKFVLDNSSDKVGKRLYGTSLMVKSPSHLKNHKNGNLVIRANHYQDEIISQIKTINPNINIIE
jgi:2-polyprenyl-3-methyl-5-hydroxy-6-metoxy-1,4-benzoquinol methylase